MKIKTLMSIAAAAALAIAPSGVTVHGEAGMYLIGDINGDGLVDSADASAVLAAYAYVSSGKECPLYSYQQSAADLNGDNNVDAVDATLILSYYAWNSVSGDENAILSDFLEKNGIPQRKEETPQTEQPAAPAAAAPVSNDMPPAEDIGEAYRYPRIDSEYAEWFWIGDSRTVGMSYSVSIDCLAKVGEGIAFFKRNYDQIIKIRDKTVIINLGVNDVYNSKAYLDLYNGLPAEFLDSNKVIVLSVNPCSGSYSYLNNNIVAFNEALAAGLDSRITFLDSYSYMMHNGFGTTDGLHYTSQTYVDLYNFVYDSLHPDEKVE
ncbi:MAG: hypothetical protein K6G33_15095 [Ruminococcus sp.]|uniref:dockerin type I domain-containing protein n=1 Tax=Ruminococcus sp. TaxID=41978 RepID=UPI0025F592ED|nr:dockerin type I domain-containing protein [Ruminococcus sp.]MCR5602050.1 hypothetical protein [Ruminococcus sp.]